MGIKDISPVRITLTQKRSDRSQLLQEQESASLRHYTLLTQVVLVPIVPSRPL